MKHGIGYCRCSTAKQEKSIPEQKASINGWAEKNGYVIDRFFEDDGISGSEFDARPGFRAMIAHCKAKSAVEAVVVWDKSRFGRPENPKEAISFEWEIEKTSKRIVYVATGRMSDGSIGSVFQDVAENVEAGEKLKSLSAAICRHQLENAREGFSTGRKPAFGYDLLVVAGDGAPRKRVRYIGTGVKNRYRREIYDPTSGELRETLGAEEPLTTSRVERSRLVLGDPEQGKIVAEIFKSYLSGSGFREIANNLNTRSAPSPCGRKWYVSAVRETLTNPVYTGALIANRRTMAKFYQVDPNAGVVLRPRDQKGKVADNDVTRWIVVEESHPALVSKEDFQAAQARRESRLKNGHATGGGKGAHSVYLLSHIAICKRCKHSYQGKKSRSGKGVLTMSYVCGGYVSQGKIVCRMGTVKVANIEEPLLDLLGKVYFGIDTPAQAAAAIRAEMGAEAVDHGAEIERLRSRDRDVAAKIENWLECISPANKAILNAKLVEGTAERQRIAEEIARVEEKSREEVDVDAAGHEVLAKLRNFKALFDQGGAGTKEAVRGLVSRVTIDFEAGEALVELRPFSSFFKCGRGEPCPNTLAEQRPLRKLPISMRRKKKRS